MNIPDCRVDEHYNDKRLNARDAAFIEGFDWCLKWGVDNLFDNLDGVKKEFDLDGEDLNLVVYLNNHPKVMAALRKTITDYAEVNRNDMIVSMIDYEEGKAPEISGE